MDKVRRRQFLIAAGALLVAPLVRAQPLALPVIGYLSGGSGNFVANVAAFHRGLSETGHVEGKNVAIEYRWAEGQVDRLPGFAADLVRRQVAVIVATGGSAPALAAKAATATIPIVFTGGGDPVKLGLIASLARPGGNATGAVNYASQLTAKRLQLLREMVPSASMIAVLVNPANPITEELLKEIQTAARTVGREVQVVHARSERDLDAAFADIARTRAGALLVSADSFFMGRRAQLVALAAKHAIPASYSFPEFADAGGLMSYGADLPDVYRQVGVYTGRILKGTKPADLPVVQPSKFNLVLNAKTAKTLRITIPQSLLLRADRVIE